jgi:RNA polymerase sigma-70 factor (ECF subfamily)
MKNMNDVDERIRPLLDRGDHRGATDLLFRAYRSEVEGFVARRLPPDLIEAACAQVWDAVPDALKRFRRESTVLSWLLSIASNKASDVLRRKRIDHVPIELAVDVLFVSSSKQQSRRLAAEEMKRAVREVVSALPPADCVVLELRFVEGYLPQEMIDPIRSNGLAIRIGVVDELARIDCAGNPEDRKKAEDLLANLLSTRVRRALKRALKLVDEHPTLAR